MTDTTKRVLALDPGGTTGWAMWQDRVLKSNAGEEGDPWNHFTCGQALGPQEHHDDLWAMLERLQSHDFTVVCESFEFRQHKQRDNINLMSKEYIGIVKLFGQQNPAHTSVVFQTASKGKGFVTDQKLKAMGLYVPGRKHAMDAMRHLVTHLVQKERMMDLIESWRNL